MMEIRQFNNHMSNIALSRVIDAKQAWLASGQPSLETRYKALRQSFIECWPDYYEVLLQI